MHIEESWDGDKTSPPGTALLAAFQQVTSSMPWIPFQNDNSPIACKEKRLLMICMGNTSIMSALPYAKGYNEFEAAAWNAEASSQCRLALLLNENETLILIHYKSRFQLQEYSDQVVQHWNIIAYISVNPMESLEQRVGVVQ